MACTNLPRLTSTYLSDIASFRFSCGLPYSSPLTLSHYWIKPGSFLFWDQCTRCSLYLKYSFLNNLGNTIAVYLLSFKCLFECHLLRRATLTLCLNFPPVTLCHITLFWFSTYFLMDIFIYLINVYLSTIGCKLHQGRVLVSLANCHKSIIRLSVAFNRNVCQINKGRKMGEKRETKNT